MDERLFDTPQQRRPKAETDVFGGRPRSDGDAPRPLAARMRPPSLAQFAGQGHLLGEGSALRTAIEQGNPHSMVFYGPPGSGKTTLARLVGAAADADFVEEQAAHASRPPGRCPIQRPEQPRPRPGPPTALSHHQ